MNKPFRTSFNYWVSEFENVRTSAVWENVQEQNFYLGLHSVSVIYKAMPELFVPIAYRVCTGKPLAGCWLRYDLHD